MDVSFTPRYRADTLISFNKKGMGATEKTKETRNENSGVFLMQILHLNECRSSTHAKLI